MHGMHTWRCFLNQDGGPPQTSPSICQVTTNWLNGLRNFFLENCSPLSMFGPPVTTCDGQKHWNHWVLSNQHWALIAEFIVLFSGSETSQIGEPGQPLQNLTLDFTWWWRCSGPDWWGTCKVLMFEILRFVGKLFVSCFGSGSGVVKSQKL